MLALLPRTPPPPLAPFTYDDEPTGVGGGALGPSSCSSCSTAAVAVETMGGKTSAGAITRVAVVVVVEGASSLLSRADAAVAATPWGGCISVLCFLSVAARFGGVGLCDEIVWASDILSHDSLLVMDGMLVVT